MSLKAKGQTPKEVRDKTLNQKAMDEAIEKL
jgi:hypothetical protein